MTLDSLLNIISSLQNLLHNLFGVWVTLWIVIMTIAGGIEDPRLLLFYKKTSYMFIIFFIEIIVAEIIVALSLALKNEKLCYLSLFIFIILIFSVLYGIRVVHLKTFKK